MDNNEKIDNLITSIEETIRTKVGLRKAITLRELMLLEVEEVKWLVDELIPYKGITAIAGKPKSGKSYISLYLALCLASGQPFLDQFQVKQSPTLMISKEDDILLTRDRIEDLAAEIDLPLHFFTEQDIVFDTDSWIGGTVEFIKAYGIKVMIIDSLRRVFTGEENSSDTITRIHKNFKKIIDQTGITIIFIHHHAKDPKNERSAGDLLRGSSDIFAMVDALLVAKNDGTHLTLAQTDLRIGKPMGSVIMDFPSPENNQPYFKFITRDEKQKNKREKACEEIVELLKGEKELSQTDIIKSLKSKGFSKTTVKNAVASIAKTLLKFRDEGKQKMYSLRDESDQSKSQHTNKSDLLTQPDDGHEEA